MGPWSIAVAFRPRIAIRKRSGCRSSLRAWQLLRTLNLPASPQGLNSTRRRFRRNSPSTYRQDPPLTRSVGGRGPTVSPAQIESNGRFQILDQLGVGGMGIVYRALDRHRGETVALKTMKRVDPLSLFRFKQEFRSLADLSHPNLINLYELISARGQWFFTMELLTGTDFLTHVRQGLKPAANPTVELATAATETYVLDDNPLPMGSTHWTIFRLRQVFPQLVEGVKALHAAGKLHRDIKPSNVMVTEAGRVVLMDFGLVTDVSPMAFSLEPDRGACRYDRVHISRTVGRPAGHGSERLVQRWSDDLQGSDGPSAV